MNNDPRNSKRAFIREIIALGIISISIAPYCFVVDKLTIGFTCAAWLILNLIIVLCHISIYWQRSWNKRP